MGLRAALSALTLGGAAMACPFSRDTAGRLPLDHPPVGGSARRALQAMTGAGAGAPDATVPDRAGGMFPIPGGGITVPRSEYGGLTTADVIDGMAKASVAKGSGPLCYWSWQSLPPPPLDGPNDWGPRGQYDFAKMEKAYPGDVAAIRDLCTFAVGRLQAHVDPVGHSGVNVLAAVTEGTEFASYLCRQGLHLDKASHPERCAVGAPIYNQSWGLRWPMSVTMWKFDGTNGAEVTKVMKDWRTNPNQHADNIASPAPAPGPGSAPLPIPTGGVWPKKGTLWGPGGAVVGKALPCNAIPDRFKYRSPFPQDTSPDPGQSTRGKTYLDEALEYWSTTPGWPMPLSACAVEQAKVCGSAAKSGVLQCEMCLGRNQMALKKAGCGFGDNQQFCAGAEK